METQRKVYIFEQTVVIFKGKTEGILVIRTFRRSPFYKQPEEKLYGHSEESTFGHCVYM